MGSMFLLCSDENVWSLLGLIMQNINLQKKSGSSIAQISQLILQPNFGPISSDLRHQLTLVFLKWNFLANVTNRFFNSQKLRNLCQLKCNISLIYHKTLMIINSRSIVCCFSKKLKQLNFTPVKCHLPHIIGQMPSLKCYLSNFADISYMSDLTYQMTRIKCQLAPDTWPVASQISSITCLQSFFTSHCG